MKRIEINMLDLFSGIGGFSKGFIDAGYKINKHYYSEIDRHAIAVYKNNFKESIYAGPVELIQSGGIERPDVITFGSPCQDFSLAGRREGLEGERSSLVLEAIRIISELRPSVFIWENVKGAFSSNDGADFWAILQAFANIGGYRLEWQLLNTVWFLPQNRERIYLIGHLAGRSEPGVFPIGEEASVRNEGERQESNSVARTLSANDEKSWVGNYLKIGAFRGRNPDNPSQRVAGQRNEQVLELNQKGVSNTLTSVQKDNVVVQIPANTKKGYEVLREGDSLNFSVPTSKTRRGRVGKGVAQTLDTSCNQAVIAKKNYIQCDASGNDCKPSEITESKVNVIANDFNIRRLTEIECERLQGFPDDWTKLGIYDGVEKIVPKTQRYKMIGNAVTVNVVREIAKRILLK